MDFKQIYTKDDFVKFLKGFLPDDFEVDQEELTSDHSFKFVEKVAKLGECKSLDLKIYEIDHKSENDPRVTLSKEAFRLMRSYASRRSLIIFKNPKTRNYRLSLITFQTSWDEGKKIKTEYSNPRRFSFYLGPDARTKTPEKFLVKLGKAKDFDDLVSRFSVEVVNKDFYQDIAIFFNRLTGGDIKISTKVQHFEPEMTLPSIDKEDKKTYQEFAVRLIGRIIFCWFLKQKKSSDGISLMPDEFVSTKAVRNNENYYHSILEKIFFEVLNRPKNQRKPGLVNGFDKIPYLNGGLFDPHYDDFYENQPNWALKAPDNWFGDLFEILETYNFTIDENTVMDVDLSIDPEMLGRIFENLLAEINPETGESARKSTGSYYTPRSIVEYMVDQSLVQYLIAKTQINEKKINALVSLDESDDSEYPLAQGEKERVVEALNEVKIIDPACGSGAFPIGILQKIVWILGRVDSDGKLWFEKKTENIDPLLKADFKKKFANENFDYIRKTGVIRDSIYGVDIQPIAVEVSKLRCFLTLIVDEDIDENIENRGIKPLPNLEFKFVAANTLIDLPGSGTNNNGQAGLFEHREDIEQLKKLRDQYFVSTGYEKIEIRSKFKDAQREMFKKQIAVLGQGHMTMALADWDPFKDISSSWFDPEWMFGIKSFDIVIANPPYISHDKIKEKGYIKENYECFEAFADIYCYFIERAISILSNTGIICFITSNSYLKTNYGKPIRRLLNMQTEILSIINIEDFQLFDSAIVNTAILIAQKGHDISRMCRIVNKSYEKSASFNNFVDSHSFFSCQDEFNDDVWGLLQENKSKLRKKISSCGNTLSNLKTKIRLGIATGANEAFVIDQDKRDMLISSDPQNINIIKPILRGRDISRYEYSFAKKYLLLTRNDIDVKREYPTIYNYLDEFGEDFKNRGAKGKHWSNLRPCAFFDDFKKEKIIWIELTDKSKFALCDEEMYLVNSAYFMLPPTGFPSRYLLGILNSKLVQFYLSLFAETSGMGTIRWINEFVGKVPVPSITDKTKNIVEDIIDAVTRVEGDKKSKSETASMEKSIDQMVYRLYDLTPDEIKIVEGVKNE
ncbi:MAG: Modification methylase PaeR7I [Ignavibacteria bacterium ADurb.Bin266]|nr:MAG: Modification methylase PaeR7I [Ignavibacteria bacterium ADurb.Bin266]